MSKSKDTRIIYRDAVDGQFVTKDYANDHPRTTEKEHRPAPKPPSKK